MKITSTNNNANRKHDTNYDIETKRLTETPKITYLDFYEILVETRCHRKFLDMFGQKELKEKLRTSGLYVRSRRCIGS